MKITVNEKMIASEGVIQEQIAIELESRGYAVKGSTVTETVPYRVDDIPEGLFFKTIYHKWYWKVITRFWIEKDKNALGKYTLFMEIPFRGNTFTDRDEFIEGLGLRLRDLKESLDVVFIQVTNFFPYTEDNVPIY